MLLFLSAAGQQRGSRIFHTVLTASFLVHTAAIALRTYIGGRLPFSNGYETMLLTAWCAMLIAVLWGRKIRLLIPFGFLLSGCTLLVAHIGSMNPKITPLVPVLSSPLLSIHVSVIMLSYTLFGFVALNSLTTFVRILTAGKNSGKDVETMLERNKIYSLICLYPALFLLGSGIFIGAIWANISWGRYWGWDPKEVWALITFMLYGLVFHRHMKIVNNAFVFHVFGLYAFASVLMTYFGVNYLLGGMHSYAGEMQMGQTALITIIALASVSAFVAITYLRFRRLRINQLIS
ncbi:MAG: cytochrome c biogenesis protein CcsA [Prevotellaceae bacterium]|nr:cytochrome c biogenesis protein CcsA [Prevotellaceae bacterium]